MKYEKLSIKGLALAFGTIWAISVFFVATANIKWPGYGSVFLECISSIYPGYQPMLGVKSVVTGTCYAFADGLIGGALFAWLYNYFTGKK